MKRVFLAIVIIQFLLHGCGGGSESTTETPRQNQPPVAVITAPSQAIAGAEVSLNGLSSIDPENYNLTFSWELRSAPSESTAELSTLSGSATTFVADKVGDYEISLIVGDGELASTPTILIISNVHPYLADTGQASSFTDTYGEDSDYQGKQLDFVDNNGTISDVLTGLLWQKSPDMAYRTYTNAQQYCSNLTLDNKNNWRTPNKKELFGILDFGSFPHVREPFYRDSGSSPWFWTTMSSVFQGATVILNVDYGSGLLLNDTTSQNTRCVSGNQIGFGDFYDNNDETVSDHLTGLQWIKNESSHMTWEEALSYCEPLDFASYTDWRLPNIKEAISLPDQYYTPDVNSLHFPGSFQNAKFDALGNRVNVYWSSTTNFTLTEHALTYDISFGLPRSYTKDQEFGVRCVRGGRD